MPSGENGGEDDIYQRGGKRARVWAHAVVEAREPSEYEERRKEHHRHHERHRRQNMNVTEDIFEEHGRYVAVWDLVSRRRRGWESNDARTRRRRVIDDPRILVFQLVVAVGWHLI